MKKIMLLGGSAQQITAIETAKKLGFYTVLCDYLPDNPGQLHADKFYLESTTDKEKMLEIARNEKIDGVIAYASDPAAPTAAYVAEKLGLPTNPYNSVVTLCNKDLLRAFLRENGFAVPWAYAICDEINPALPEDYPAIVKPVDSSGSKGVTVARNEDEFRAAVRKAAEFTRCKRIICEEFIEKEHKYLIGGDIFITNGKITIWGLLNCHRDENVNKLVPVGKSYPLELSKEDERLAKETLMRLVEKLGIRFGAMNVELVISRGKCYIIDAGPRAGGNMIPELLGDIFNARVVEMAVNSAMGEKVTECEAVAPRGAFFATHNLHSQNSGVLSDIIFDDEIEKYIYRKCIYNKPGESVNRFNDSRDALGIVFMKFDTLEEENKILENIDKHITVRLK